MSKVSLLPSDYSAFLNAVKERVRTARYAALEAVNTELVGLYWDIGRMIVERQSGGTWDKAVVQKLAEDLQSEFPGVSGFSASNLWRINGLVDAYQDHEKLAPLVRGIAWSYNLVILEQFYLIALDRQVRQRDENSSIGIIICKDKKRTVVEYDLHDARKPIGVATYQIRKTLPKSLAGQLPSPEKIAALMKSFDEEDNP